MVFVRHLSFVLGHRCN